MKFIGMKYWMTVVLIILVPLGSCKNSGPVENKTVSTPGPQSDVKIADDSFFEAALNGDTALVMSVIKSGISVNQKDPEGRTALMYASYNGHNELVSMLIKKGADVNIRDKYGRTALMMAASGPFSETVKILLESNAWPDLVDNEEHFTALMYAAAEGQMDNVRMLLEKKADPTIKDVDGDDALAFAISNNHTGVAELLRKYTGK